ncbi:MAG TPA: hypothetical protein TECP_00388 [Hyphomicrobiaceae bacterium MAG_BT-2024]
MQSQQISLESLSDIYDLRIVVEDLSLCYRILGLVRTK